MGGRGANYSNIKRISANGTNFYKGDTFRTEYNDGGQMIYRTFEVTEINNDNTIEATYKGTTALYSLYKENEVVTMSVENLNRGNATVIKQNRKARDSYNSSTKKQMNTIRNKLDKAGIKYPNSISLKQLQSIYNQNKKAGLVK